MKKLIMILAILSMLVISVVPAMAQFDQDGEQEADSGDVDQSFEVSNSGDNSNVCNSIQGVGNTGNAQNSLQSIQYGSEADEFELSGDASVDVSPSNSTECSQSVNQFANAEG